MYLESEQYRVTIRVDTAFSPGSAVDSNYDIVLNPGNLTDNIKVFRIEVDQDNATTRIALIGSQHSREADCAILHRSHLIVLLDEAVVQIEVSNGHVRKYVELDSFGTNFSIYECPAGYLIHGEIEITMLDFDFEKAWTFSGRDTFVTSDEEPALELCGDIICLRDRSGSYYELDYLGDLLTDISA